LLFLRILFLFFFQAAFVSRTNNAEHLFNFVILAR
jgi:hypothetical protein